MNSLAKIIRKWSRAIIGLSLLISLYLLSTLPNMEIRNPPGRMDLPEYDPVFQEYQLFQNSFGGGDLIIIAFSFDDSLGLPQLHMIERVSDELAGWPEVQSLSSIANAARPLWQRDSLKMVPLYRRGNTAMQRLRRFLTAEPLFSENVISADGKSAAIVLQVTKNLVTSGNTAEPYAKFISRIENTLSIDKAFFSEYYLIGYPLLRVTFQKALKKNVTIFGGLSFFLFFIALFLIFRNWKTVILIFLLALNSLLWNLGVLSLTHTALSMGLAIMIPLIPVLSIAYALHFLDFYRRRHDSAQTPAQHFQNMIAAILPPTLLTGGSTVLGFFSLMVSNLSGVRDMGLFLGIGAFICMLQACFLLPACLWQFRSGEIFFRQARSFTGSLSLAIAALVQKRGNRIILFCAVLGILLLTGFFKLNIATNHLFYFPESNPLRQGYRFVDGHFGGGLPLEITLQVSPDEIGQLIQKLPEYQKKLCELPGMGKVTSVYDVLLLADKWKPYAAGAFFDIKRGIFPAGIWQKIAIANIGRSFLRADSSFITVRIAARVQVAESARLKTLLQQVEPLTRRYFPQNPILITGLVPLLIRTQEYILDSQIQSFSIAFGIILLLFILIARSLRIGLLVTLANTLPILGVLGFMGWVNIPLDTITIFIASIALGIVVDDTIHFMYRFRENTKSTENANQVLPQTFAFVGPPVISTSLVISGGFLVLATSDFLPIRYFGILAALTVVAALLANLFLLPALLERFRKTANIGNHENPANHSKGGTTW